MTNILILAAEDSHDDRDSGYSLCLTEIAGKPLIQHLIEKCGAVDAPRLIVALRDADCKRWHLDNVVGQLSAEAEILRVTHRTAGAACTALLAISTINVDEPLLILNGNELIDMDFGAPIRKFVEEDYDGGAVTFNSVHPRYSFVRLDANDMIVETAEKNPISQHATVGFYWFRSGRMFVDAAERSILKSAHVDGVYYICPTMNEMILQHAKLGVYPIEAQQFHPLKSERQIGRLDASLDGKRAHA